MVAITWPIIRTTSTRSPLTARPLWEYAALTGALVAGALAVFWRLPSASPFSDEAFMAHVGRMSVPALLHEVATLDFTPPLGHLIAHYLMLWTGKPFTELRYFSAAPHLLTIFATWGIARRLFGSLAAAIAAFMIAFEPGMVMWARFFRHYGLFWALATSTWWIILIACEARGWVRLCWWALYAAVATAVLYLHYLGAFVLLAQALYALTSIRTAWPALVGVTVAAIALIPWRWGFSMQFARHWTLASTDATSARWWLDLLNAGFGRFLPIAGHQAATIVLGALIVSTCCYALWVYRRTMFPYWVLPFVLAALATVVLGKNAISRDRYWFVIAPAVATAVGAASARMLVSGRRALGVALPAALIAANAFGTIIYLFDPFYQAADWRQAGSYIAARSRPHDLAIIDQPHYLFLVAELSDFHRLLIFQSGPPYGKRAAAWAAAHPGVRIWYLMNHPLYRDEVRPALGAHRRRLLTWIQPRLDAPAELSIELYGPASR